MTMTTNTATNKIAAFHADEEGSMTILGLFFFICMAIIGSFALDVMSIYSARTHLQTAADQAAHAALYNRNLMDEDSAKAEALIIANATLPSWRYGFSLLASDIQFGQFDAETRAFTAENGAIGAVRVRTGFREGRGNALKSFLMKLVGMDQFSIVTESIYTAYLPGCMTEGFVAEGVVDIQSNNVFSGGFCIHSNDYVSLNSNNTFEAGTVVSMPSIDDLDLPRSGFETNEGLSAALRSATMNIRVLARVENMVYKYENPTATYASYPIPSIAPDTPDLPDYITSATPISSRQQTITTAEIYALEGNTGRGRVHMMDCKGGSGLTIDASAAPLRDVVIISPCEIKFASGSGIEDARIISKATSDDSISSPSGLRVGKRDNCAEGGGAQLITRGGMRFPAALEVNGSQLMAKGDINFAANADGLQGASLIAGGEISGTSNMNMSLCMTGMEDNVMIRYFRLAG